MTEKECALGVSFYPDFAYNAEGGGGYGELDEFGTPASGMRVARGLIILSVFQYKFCKREPSSDVHTTGLLVLCSRR